MKPYNKISHVPVEKSVTIRDGTESKVGSGRGDHHGSRCQARPEHRQHAQQ